MFKDMLTNIIGHHKVPEESFTIEVKNDAVDYNDDINKSEIVKIRTPPKHPAGIKS